VPHQKSDRKIALQNRIAKSHRKIPSQNRIAKFHRKIGSQNCIAKSHSIMFCPKYFNQSCNKQREHVLRIFLTNNFPSPTFLAFCQTLKRNPDSSVIFVSLLVLLHQPAYFHFVRLLQPDKLFEAGVSNRLK
jgi:hypothetical protein